MPKWAFSRGAVLFTAAVMLAAAVMVAAADSETDLREIAAGRAAASGWAG